MTMQALSLTASDKTSDLQVITFFHPAAIMEDPDRLAGLIVSYYTRVRRSYKLIPTPKNTQENTDENTPEDTTKNKTPPLIPTPASLALHLGFASALQMVRATEDDTYPKESVYLLARAITQLEDFLTVGALTDSLNVPMTKFVLSARLGMAERSERHTTTDDSLTVTVGGLEGSPYMENPQDPQATIEEEDLI